LLVAVASVVFPAGMALAYPPANPVRALPATVEKGETFNVTVTFSAPSDDFRLISLSDFAPTGWNVTVDGAWCQPEATMVKATGNQSELGWYLSSYPNGTNFTALYKVTVPCGAELGNYIFGGYIMYYVGGNATHFYEGITGDCEVEVVRPAICFAPAPINFYASLGGQNPPNQTAELWSSTPCMLNWSLTDDADWLEVYPTNGSCTDAHSFVNLSVNASGMLVGAHPANITIESPEANNSPHIVNVTLHITLTGTLQGQVNFIGRGAPGSDNWIENFKVKLFEPGNLGNVLWEGNATTNNTGVFTIPDVIATTYDIGIKNWTSLSVLKTNVTVTAGVITPVDFGGIRQGDCKNNDDKVTLQDRILMYSLWGGSDFRGDLKRDGTVGLPDRILMYSYWGQSGDLGGQGGFVP